MAKSPKAPEMEAAVPKPGIRVRIIEALMALAGERAWADISISDVTGRAEVTLAEFREQFPSKGAVIGAWSKMIDMAVLSGSGADLADEPPKERLFDVLMRRLDAMAPYKAGLEGIMRWVRQDGAAALALNQVALNSMRFMLEAAQIDSEGPLGALKLQGLTIAWARIVAVWLKDDSAGLDATMAAMDKELARGGQILARAEDFGRLTAPLQMMAQTLCNARTDMRTRMRERSQSSPGPDAASTASA